MQQYSDADTFFSLFEADTFDEEVVEGKLFKGYVYVGSVRTLAAEFDYASNEGYYDDTLL